MGDVGGPFNRIILKRSDHFVVTACAKSSGYEKQVIFLNIFAGGYLTAAYLFILVDRNGGEL